MDFSEWRFWWQHEWFCIWTYAIFSKATLVGPANIQTRWNNILRHTTHNMHWINVRLSFVDRTNWNGLCMLFNSQTVVVPSQRENGDLRSNGNTANGKACSPSCFRNGFICCSVSVNGFLKFRPVSYENQFDLNKSIFVLLSNLWRHVCVEMW